MTTADRSKSATLRWLHALAAPRWTVLFFLLTAAAALAVAYEAIPATALLATPFALLILNLAAAIFVQPRFRADLPLLLFHLALVALVALFVLARLVYLDARTTLTSGTAFDGQLQREERGPLHRWRPQDLRFANDGFTEDFYAQGRGKHHATYNRVHWQDDAGQWHVAQIGDDHPLILNGYKIYTTRHRGFSPVFRWQSKAGAEEYGTAQLSAQQDGAFASSAAWRLPSGAQAWAMLDIKKPDERRSGTRTDLGAKELEHNLVLRIEQRSGQQRHVLKEGQSVELDEGTLTYVRLDSWMGYMISYDPTLPWIMGTILLGVGSLVWFYWRRIW